MNVQANTIQRKIVSDVCTPYSAISRRAQNVRRPAVNPKRRDGRSNAALQTRSSLTTQARLRLTLCRAYDGEPAEGSLDEPDESVDKAEEGQDTVDMTEEKPEDLMAKLKDQLDEDLLGEVGTVLDRVNELEVALKASQASDQATKDAMLRLSADFENFRKRTAREKEQLSTTAKMNMIEQLLPVVDNFELAKNSVKTTTEGEEKIDAAYQATPRVCLCSRCTWKAVLFTVVGHIHRTNPSSWRALAGYLFACKLAMSRHHRISSSMISL